jgi:hypothetical protein
MYVAAAGLTPISPVIWVVPVVEIPVFARIAKLAAVPRGTGVSMCVDVDVGVVVCVGVGVCVDVDVGVVVCVGVGVCVDVDVGVVVCVGVGVCVDVDVGVVVCVGVGVGVGVARVQADTSVMANIKMRDIVSPSIVFFFIGSLLFKIH